MLNQKNKKTVEKKETSNCWNERKVELLKETSNNLIVEMKEK